MYWSDIALAPRARWIDKAITRLRGDTSRDWWTLCVTLWFVQDDWGHKGWSFRRRWRRSPRAALDLRGRLLEMGLPLMLDRADRARHLLARSAGALAVCAVVSVGLSLLDTAFSLFSEAELEQAELTLSIDDDRLYGVGAGLMVLLMVPPVWFAVRMLVRRSSATVGRGVGFLAAAALIFLPSALAEITVPVLTERVILTGVLLAGTYWGVGAVLGWAGRRALQELSRLAPMVSRVLPVLAIAVLFSFVNTEMWQVADRLTMRRTWAVVAVFGALCVILVVVNSRDEAQEIFARHADTVMESELHHRHDAALHRGERLNIMAVMVLVTLIQVVLLAILLFTFFVLFGVLAVSNDTIATWLGHRPGKFDGVLGQLPVSRALVQVSLILAAFSALQFAASAGTDLGYRRSFVEPLLREVDDGLQLRQRYRADRAARPDNDDRSGQLGDGGVLSSGPHTEKPQS